jgi:hypothetical protein
MKRIIRETIVNYMINNSYHAAFAIAQINWEIVNTEKVYSPKPQTANQYGRH